MWSYGADFPPPSLSVFRKQEPEAAVPAPAAAKASLAPTYAPRTERSVLQNLRAAITVDRLLLGAIGAAVLGATGLVGLSCWHPSAPSRVPNVEEIRGLETQQLSTQIGERRFFVDQGRVWEKDLSTNGLKHLGGYFAKDVHALVVFKSQLIAVQTDGDVHLWNDANKSWIDIGNKARKVLVAGDTLMAHTDNNQLWLYRGAPGAEINIPVTTNINAGNGVNIPITTNVAAGHQIAFVDAGVRNVANIRPAPNGDVHVDFANGTSKLFSELVK